MKPEFIIERQGKQAVLYAGLLDFAHEKGLKSIVTSLIQTPTEGNNFTAISFATVTMESGQVFTGIGDANLANVGKMVQAHIIRMSETRAKARALRDACNIGAAALEEFGDDVPETAIPAATKPVQAAKPAPLTVIEGGEEPEHGLTAWGELLARAMEFGFASEDTRDYIYLVAKLCEGMEIKKDERYLYAAGENALAWETAIEQLKARKQRAGREAVTA